MHFLKTVVAAMLPLTTVIHAVSVPDSLGDRIATLSPVERAYVDNLLRDPAASHLLVERQTDLTSALDQLLDLLTSLGQFLNTDFLNATHDVVINLNTLLADPFVGDTRGIIVQASGLLDSVSPLLDQITSINITDIVSSLSPLLSSDSITGIATLLTNAENLLTADFVSEVTSLINDVAPVSPIHPRVLFQRYLANLACTPS